MGMFAAQCSNAVPHPAGDHETEDQDRDGRQHIAEQTGEEFDRQQVWQRFAIIDFGIQ